MLKMLNCRDSFATTLVSCCFLQLSRFFRSCVYFFLSCLFFHTVVVLYGAPLIEWVCCVDAHHALFLFMYSLNGRCVKEWRAMYLLADVCRHWSLYLDRILCTHQCFNPNQTVETEGNKCSCWEPSYINVVSSQLHKYVHSEIILYLPF